MNGRPAGRRKGGRNDGGRTGEREGEKMEVGTEEEVQLKYMYFFIHWFHQIQCTALKENTGA